jgi:hypothetical protein
MSKYYYQLSFDIDFDKAGGKAYIAMCPPYSYTKLMKTIRTCEEIANKSSDT